MTEVKSCNKIMQTTCQRVSQMSHVMRKPVYANNKGADQSAHPRSLISTFVFRCLDSIIPLVSKSEISSHYLAYVAAEASLCLT